MRNDSEGQERREKQERGVVTFEYFLKPGYVLVNREDSLVRTVVGNSVTVTIFDRRHRFGGINNFVLPISRERSRATPQFGNVAVTALCRMMFDLGGNPRTLEAQIMGGASNLEVEDEGLGMQNVYIARRMLEKFRIPVVSEDVGGRRGRKVLYHSGTNETVIYKVDKIRESDWFTPDIDLQFA